MPCRSGLRLRKLNQSGNLSFTQRDSGSQIGRGDLLFVLEAKDQAFAEYQITPPNSCTTQGKVLVLAVMAVLQTWSQRTPSRHFIWVTFGTVGKQNFLAIWRLLVRPALSLLSHGFTLSAAIRISLARSNEQNQYIIWPIQDPLLQFVACSFFTSCFIWVGTNSCGSQDVPDKHWQHRKSNYGLYSGL